MSGEGNIKLNKGFWYISMYFVSSWSEQASVFHARCMRVFEHSRCQKTLIGKTKLKKHYTRELILLFFFVFFTVY